MLVHREYTRKDVITHSPSEIIFMKNNNRVAIVQAR
jgi:hypothetical protein